METYFLQRLLDEEVSPHKGRCSAVIDILENVVERTKDFPDIELSRHVNGIEQELDEARQRDMKKKNQRRKQALLEKQLKQEAARNRAAQPMKNCRMKGVLW